MMKISQTIVKVKCIDQVLEVLEAPVIASGGFYEDKILFEFGPLWDGFTKIATFYIKKDETYYAEVDFDNYCIIPHEVLEKAGNMFFGVMGVNTEEITRTSEVIKYKIVQGAISEGHKPSDPTPDIYEQILAKLNTAVLGITNIEESDEDGGSNVVTFTNGATLTVKNGRQGSTGANGKDGADGKDGINGKDGIDGIDGTSVSIVSITQSAEDGGSNVVTFSDGSTLTVKNGSGGANIIVDTELSEESENPVQNKVITTQFNAALDGVSQGMDQMEQAITALYTVMYSELATPASVDMSGFDSGTIVETFADGSTKTTTIEFDTNGNPTKITDGDGRVTTYVW